MSNRKEATAELLYFIERLAPDSGNRGIYEKRLKKMTDSEFAAFMERLYTEEETLALFIANLGESSVDVEQMFDVAKEVGHEFFQRVWITDPETGQVKLTPIPHMVVHLPLRRQAQMLYKKVSIPESNRVVDERSGQATGESKGARVSYPELQVNAAKGLDNSILEMIKFRGGDERSYTAMNRSIMETGEASLESIHALEPSAVKANQTLRAYLRGMHLKANL